MMSNKQCAVCEGHYDASMLVGIMDTYMCNVCALEMDGLMKIDLGDDYKRNLPKSKVRQLENVTHFIPTNVEIPVFTLHSPIHPKVELEPTTA